ncbi:hypothetical protein EZV62_010946 [Acer yangbiense]|uniref:CCHC-type domain-containing protein n=1 Tax=Acer yangbiense TaxID=1000413 RepID=A0A5C7I5Z8_9ROSI|nr:hypothetical protein EZV62_010946 [Acer yangbiense]
MDGNEAKFKDPAVDLNTRGRQSGKRNDACEQPNMIDGRGQPNMNPLEDENERNMNYFNKESAQFGFMVQELQGQNDRERDLEIVELRRDVELLQIQLEQHDEDHVNLRQHRQPNRRYGDVKVDVPEFNGKMQGDVFLNWLYTVERIFDFKEYSEERKVKALQDSLGGLKRNIADVIRLQPYWSFNDVRKLAINVEQQWVKYSPRTATKPSSSNQGSISSIQSKTLTKVADSSKAETKGEGGSTKRPANNSIATRKCFKCQGYGHIASKCPNRKVVTIIEDVVDENEEELNKEEEDFEEVTQYTDEGEALVIRMSLHMVFESF